MEGNREPFAPHRGGRRGVGTAEGRRLQRSTTRATTGTAPPTRATRASSVAVAVVFVAVVARGGPPWGSPLWCLIRVLLRFFAATCGSGAVLSASRRAGCAGPGGRPCGGASSRFHGQWSMVDSSGLGFAHYRKCMPYPSPSRTATGKKVNYLTLELEEN